MFLWNCNNLISVEWSSFEHDFIEEDNLAEPKELSSKLLPVEPEKSEQGSTVWNAKVGHL